MRKFIIAGVVAAALATPAFANDIEDQCTAARTENGLDTAGCACVGEKADADPALAEALAAVETDEDFEALDQATKDAVMACFPDA